jgi:hypothetical protein
MLQITIRIADFAPTSYVDYRHDKCRSSLQQHIDDCVKAVNSNSVNKNSTRKYIDNLIFVVDHIRGQHINFAHVHIYLHMYIFSILSIVCQLFANVSHIVCQDSGDNKPPLM